MYMYAKSEKGTSFFIFAYFSKKECQTPPRGNLAAHHGSEHFRKLLFRLLLLGFFLFGGSFGYFIEIQPTFLHHQGAGF